MTAALTHQEDEYSTNNSAINSTLLQEKSPRADQSFIYQYCGSEHCRTITAVIFNSTGNDSYEPAKLIAEKFSIPFYIVHHVKKDEFLKQSIRLQKFEHGILQQEMNTWRSFAKSLRNLQLVHQEHSDSLFCKNHYSGKWLNAGQKVGEAGEDFSLWNMLRALPGVRHLQIKQHIWCEECFASLAFIDSMTLKEDYLSTIKMTRMSRFIASAVECFYFLIHNRQGSTSKQVCLSAWEPSSAQPYRFTENVSKRDFDTEINKIKESHRSNCQRRR